MSKIEVQGHRGCRGLYPENSVPGFLHAVDLGVQTLEMDVCISKDLKVIVSHEPWFDHEICLHPSGDTINFKTVKEQKIYDMTVEEIQKYDCGSRGHRYFPNQKNIKTYKPELSEVVLNVEKYIAENNLPLIEYNIETKTRPEWDTIYTPPPDKFVSLLFDELNELGILERTTVQSFDTRTIELIHKMKSPLKISYLISNNEGHKKNLEKLSFKPDIYSPNYLFIDKPEVQAIQKLGIRVIPWTVNIAEDVQKVIEMEVDGIISDYPDEIISFLKNK